MILWREWKQKQVDSRLHWDIWSQLKSSISVQSFSWEGQSLARHHKTEWVILKWLCKLSRSPGAHWSTFLSPALQEWFFVFLLVLSLSGKEKNSVGSLVLNPVARGGTATISICWGHSLSYSETPSEISLKSFWLITLVNNWVTPSNLYTSAFYTENYMDICLLPFLGSID